MPTKKKISARSLNSIDSALEAIIDQWYLSVSDYYLTAEKKVENPSNTDPEELKRFHDELGHRIKFNKGDLDFTYGLALNGQQDNCVLEVSVNNKVPKLNYGELVRRLAAHYESARGKTIEGIKGLKKVPCGLVFQLQDDLQNSLTVEQKEGKADIVRLSFVVQSEYLEELIAQPADLMELLHQYCVAPLRRVYAEVYRIKRK